MQRNIAGIWGGREACALPHVMCPWISRSVNLVIFKSCISTWRRFTACARFGDILFRPFLKRCTSSSYELHKSYSVSLVLVPKFNCTGISSQISTKLRDWAVWQARDGCYSQAALSTNDSKTQNGDIYHF